MSGVPAMVAGRQAWAAGQWAAGKREKAAAVQWIGEAELHFGPLLCNCFNCILNWI